MLHIKSTISPVTAKLPLLLALPFSATAELPLGAFYHSQRHKGYITCYISKVQYKVKLVKSKITDNKTLSNQYPIANPYSIIVFKGQWLTTNSMQHW